MGLILHVDLEWHQLLKDGALLSLVPRNQEDLDRALAPPASRTCPIFQLDDFKHAHTLKRLDIVFLMLANDTLDV